jgi:hypothetical protein
MKMFADASGFTAWSSLQEPSQVFKQLKAFNHDCDEVAARRGVFKMVRRAIGTDRTF